MGACCTGKEHKADNKNEEITIKNIKNHYINEYSSNLPEIEYEIEKTEYSKIINSIVKKYSRNDDKILSDIKIYSIEQLWNICKFHNDDYSNSEYLLLDIRESSKRKENFLKKFRMINYNTQQLRMLKESALGRFKNFINRKHIIIISDHSSVETLEEYISFMLDLELDIKLCILDNDMESPSHSNKYLLSVLEDKHFHNFPYIFLSLKYFPRIMSDKYIFLSITNSGIDSSNPNKNEQNMVSFKQFNNINTVINIINSSESENRKDKNLISLNIQNTDDIISQRDTIAKIAETIRDKMKSQSCVIINISNLIAKSDTMLYLTFFLALKVLNINLKKFKSYAYDNFIFIDKIKEYCTTYFNK
jgi:hypothetical protein